MDHLLRNLLLGKERIPSRTEYKFAMLRGEFALLMFLVSTFYIILDTANGIFVFLPWYGVIYFVGFVTIYLNRSRFYLLANLTILLAINTLIYLFADADHPQGGVYFFLITSSLAGLILFSQERKYLGAVFALLPVLLGFLAYMFDSSIVPPPSNKAGMLQINFLANFSIGTLTSIFIIQFLIRRNKESENSLVESREHISKTTDELRKSEERFALAVKGTRAGIYEWNADLDKLYVSDYWKTLLGFSTQEMTVVTLQTFLDLLHPEDVARISSSVTQHLQDQLPYQNEMRLRTKDGTYKWFQDSGIIRKDKSGTMLVIGSIIDIQERKLAEEKILSQNELLAKANKELDYFVYSVSHDLRAPLSSILGLTNIYSLGSSDKEKKDVVRMIGDRAHVLDDFIREVLDYSRNARLDLKLQEINMAKIVKEVFGGLAHMDGFREVRTGLDIPADLTVRSDRERLKVTLSNLITNSIYYRDPAKDPRVTVRSFRENGHCVLTVEDNGIGIHKEHHAKIFEMFFKAHERAKGTGLGLYIVKETVHKLKGEIRVDSEYGVGSTFTLLLPLDIGETAHA